MAFGGALRQISYEAEHKCSHILLRAGLDLDLAAPRLHDVDIRLGHDNPTHLRSPTTALVPWQVHSREPCDDELEALAMEIEGKRLSDREDDAVVGFQEGVCHFVSLEDFGNL